MLDKQLIVFDLFIVAVLAQSSEEELAGYDKKARY